MAEHDELVERQTRLIEIRNQYYDVLMGYPGVIEVAIGFKQVGAEMTDEPSIVVLVERKKLEIEMPREEILPKEIGGIRIDVMPFSEGQPEVLEPGDAVQGERSNGQGTLGFFATVTATSETVLVSNRHVLYDSGGQDGDEIGSPTHSSCCCCTCNEVAKNLKAVVADDCAMAKLDSDTKFKTAIPGVGMPTGTADAVFGMTVTKHGFTTDVTTGLITMVTPGPPGVPVFTFRVQTDGGNKNFTKPGDSGSAVVDVATKKIVGLHKSGCNTPVASGATGSEGCVGPVPPFFSTSIGIGRVLTALGIVPLTADPADELFVRDGRRIGESPFEELAERLRQSPSGMQMVDLFHAHWKECLDLVRQNRAVTVAWHRSQGPAWLAALARSIKVTEYAIPGDIDGIDRSTALQRIRAEIERRASDDLRAAIETHGDAIVDMLTRHDTVEAMIAEWEQLVGATAGLTVGAGIVRS